MKCRECGDTKRNDVLFYCSACRELGIHDLNCIEHAELCRHGGKVLRGEKVRKRTFGDEAKKLGERFDVESLRKL
jgi:hypothetical protein